MLSGGGRDFVHQQTLSEKTALGVAQACHPDWGPYSLLLPVLFGVQPRQPECEQKLDPPMLAFFRIPACHHMLIILVCSGLDGRDLGGASLLHSKEVPVSLAKWPGCDNCFYRGLAKPEKQPTLSS